MQAGNDDVGLLTTVWGADPDALLTRDFTTTGARNHYGLSDPLIDQNVVKARATAAVADRQKLYQPIFKKIIDDNDRWWLGVIPAPTPIAYNPKTVGALPLGGYPGGFPIVDIAWVKSG
jgi:ABC-type transport system substrate-binding protein